MGERKRGWGWVRRIQMFGWHFSEDVAKRQRCVKRLTDDLDDNIMTSNDDGGEKLIPPTAHPH